LRFEKKKKKLGKKGFISRDHLKLNLMEKYAFTIFILITVCSPTYKEKLEHKLQCIIYKSGTGPKILKFLVQSKILIPACHVNLFARIDWALASSVTIWKKK